MFELRKALARQLVYPLAFFLTACGGGGSGGSGGSGPDSPEPGQFSLSISIEGEGRVTSAPSGIDCSQTCSANFDANTAIVLTATPGPGYRFSHWNLDSCGTSSVCELELSANNSIPAVFAAQLVGRPFLFKADEARLKASINNEDPEAVGSGGNNGGQPLGFITLMYGALYNRDYYSDIPTFQIAFAGWLDDNAEMLQMAHDEVMALVNSDPDGDQEHSSHFQHVESRMQMVAATADLAYDFFTNEELTLVAGWVNGTLDNWNQQNISFWPFDEPRNNYWQNGFLAHVVAGIATRDFNPRAGEWRARAEEMAIKWIKVSTAPEWQGPVQSEGHYYAGYVGNALWAMQLYDAAEGTNFLQQSGFSAEDYLDMLMFQTRPHLQHFFLVGSEANASDARHTGLAFRYWHQLIHLAGESSEQAQHAKSLLQVADNEDATFIGRNLRGFANFYWNIGSYTAAPLDTKAERLNVTPTPGAGLIGLRSAQGFQVDACAAIMFANKFGVEAAYSHGNPDAPGFQWACGDDWIVTDPEFFHNSGILAEAGSSVLSDVSNIVTLDSQRTSNDGDFPVIRYSEDNRNSATPHFYVQIDAQPYWTDASHYQRDYVWLGEDLKILVLFDRVNSTSAKKWRLHVPTLPLVAAGEVHYSVDGKAIRVRDLTMESDWEVENLADSITSEDVWRIYQSAPAGDYRSVKVMDIDGAVQNLSLVVSGGEYRVTLTVDGEEVEVRFHADGFHAQL